MAITTVLLDGGGVIIDESEQEDIRARIISNTLSSLIKGYTTYNYRTDLAEAIKSFCPNVYKYIFWKYTEGNMPLYDELYNKHLEAWKEERPPLKLMGGFEDEAKALSSRYKLAIAGQYGREIIDLLKENSCLDYFAFQFTQDDFSLTKPDPRYFEQIAQRAVAVPVECIMVGDRIDKDIIPAKMVGMKTILVKTGIHKNQHPRVPFEIPDSELDGIWGLARTVDELAGKMGDDPSVGT
jgi:putative hydrolase of the HAD superfamily